MTIEAGTRFGPYEIGQRIGAGGMGEVYRARDTRLDRSVAIKVLSAEFAEDSQLKVRFEREAKMISQLEDPNICRLYDVGDGYLVMELLDGESLADRLSRGALPLRDALRYGVQIAEGLYRAHRRGIIHRDLKPGNVMLTKSGAKLLDFGLARTVMLRHEVKTEEVTALSPLTGEAVILGTCAYMSPEQIRAEDLDARSDVFSLGIVLYEMLSGRRPFAGGSAIELMHAIAQYDAPFLTNVPVAVAQIVHRCLEKDRDDRFQSAGDVAFALSAASAPSSGTVGVAHESAVRTRRWIWPAAAVVLVALTAVVAVRFAPRLTGASAEPEVTRFEIAFPADSPLVDDGVAISPDGRTLAYVRTRSGTRQLYLRSLASLEDAAVGASDGATTPFFSPDGKFVAFGADRKLKKVRLDGRQVVTVADSGTIAGGSWGTNGMIVYASEQIGTLFQIPENGGQPRQITTLEPARRERTHQAPQVLPGNRVVLFLSVTGFGTDAKGRVEALDLTTGKRRAIVNDGSEKSTTAFRWSDGFLFFAREGRLYAARFDPQRSANAGDASVVLEPVGGLPFGIADDGTLVYSESGPGAGRLSPWRVMRLTAAGSEQPLPIAPGRYVDLTLSPDERQLALTVALDNQLKIATADISRGTVSLLTPEGTGHLAIWTPDSLRVAYSWSGGGPSTLVWRRADGSDDPSPLTKSANHQDPGSFSPDGRWLAYADRDPNTNWDIWVMPMAQPRTPRPYLRTKAAEYSPMISPDGRHLAYVVAAVDGRPQVFIDSFPEPSSRVYVGEGKDPLWSTDGKKLYFYQNPSILAAGVSSDLSVARPQVAVDNMIEPGTGYGPAPFAVMKDGSLLTLGQTTAPSLAVATHWITEVERLTKAERTR